MKTFGRTFSGVIKYAFFISIISLPLPAADKQAAELRLTQEFAENGVSHFQFHLGRMYKEGKGVPKDNARSYAWFSIAAENGRTDARQLKRNMREGIPTGQLLQLLNSSNEACKKLKESIGSVKLSLSAALANEITRFDHLEKMAAYVRLKGIRVKPDKQLDVKLILRVPEYRRIYIEMIESGQFEQAFENLVNVEYNRHRIAGVLIPVDRGVARLDSVVQLKRAEPARVKKPARVMNERELARVAGLYSNNQLNLETESNRYLYKKTPRTSKAILLEVREFDALTRKFVSYVYVITHITGTPFSLSHTEIDWHEFHGRVSKGIGRKVVLDRIRFMKSDPRIVILPVGLPDSVAVKALGVKPFKLAANPFKYPEAFVIKENGRKYCEVDFQMNPKNSNYVKVDKSKARSNAGEFYPSQGDLVFARTGDLVGIMVNKEYCHIITGTIPAAEIGFGTNLDSKNIASVLSRMYRMIVAKPAELKQ